MILIALKCEQKVHSFVTLLQRKCVDGIRERNIELDIKRTESYFLWYHRNMYFMKTLNYVYTVVILWNTIKNKWNNVSNSKPLLLLGGIKLYERAEHSCKLGLSMSLKHMIINQTLSTLPIFSIRPWEKDH